MERALPQRPPNYSLADAVAFRDKVINQWKPISDVWAFKFGDEILGTFTILGSLYTTHVFRKELKLRPFATLTCYTPVVGLATIGVAMFQSIFISSSVLKKNSCPSCVTIRSAMGQVLFGLAYPLVVAPVVCFYVADRLLTYPVPPLGRAPKEVFQLFKKILMKSPKPFYVLAAIHTIAPIIITSQKYQNMKTLDLKIRS